MINSEWFNIEKLELLMKTKPYSELNSEERKWVNKWIESADEYENMRGSENLIRQYFNDSKANSPDLETLAHLTMHLKKKITKQQTWLWWQFRPSVANWIITLLFACLGWWMGLSSGGLNAPKTQTVQPVVVRDTIYIASQPDTVFTEKVIYRDRPVIMTQRTMHTELINKSLEMNGVNMKEKEELEKLLVSGTE